MSLIERPEGNGWIRSKFEAEFHWRVTSESVDHFIDMCRHRNVTDEQMQSFVNRLFVFSNYIHNGLRTYLEPKDIGYFERDDDQLHAAQMIDDAKKIIVEDSAGYSANFFAVTETQYHTAKMYEWFASNIESRWPLPRKPLG